ncbi:hypothetical protein COLO4_10182 [Corchorus olitorius]|uniref:Uncharacterized protein n=1 Tax=Corchorus olitorius TaxID=93759 RepID=A0A1R3K9V4_9ROSI|nr:hypothetical protein COLO4_10182 [Corchorus olitorius]
MAFLEKGGGGDEDDADTPIRYVSLDRVYSAASLCVSATNSSNVMSKKVKARKLILDNNHHDHLEPHNSPLMHVYSRRSKRSRQCVSFYDSLLEAMLLHTRANDVVFDIVLQNRYLSEQKLPRRMLQLQNGIDVDDGECASSEDEGSVDSIEDHIKDNGIQITPGGLGDAPFIIGDLQIISIGKVVKDSEYFRDDGIIWPEGYTALRKFTSVRAFKLASGRYRDLPAGYRPVRVDWKDLDKCSVCHMDELEDEDRLFLLSVDEDDESQCIRLLSFCKRHRQPSNDRLASDERIGRTVGQCSDYIPPLNPSGCARTEPYNHFGRRGRKEPEALAAASLKRLFVENQPYLVGGCCQHGLSGSTLLNNRVNGVKFSLSLNKPKAPQLDAPNNILSVAEKVQLGECLKTIIHADYPEQWPRLLDWVKHNLQDQQVYGALFVLRILARKYEFKSEEERTPVHRIVEETFPHLLNIFNGLVQIVKPALEVADLIKLICKIFWSSIYLEIPKQLLDPNVFNAWMILFLNVLERPVPLEGQPADPELRKSWGWWKPKLDVLLFEIVFPLMCFNDNDQKLWEEDPHEYVRKGYEFRSPVGHLRAKAAWVAGQYAHINFSDQNNFRQALHSVVTGLRDPELPVRVDSVFALRSFVEACRDLNEIRPILPQLLDEIFKLMNEVENEDLVFTLETIVDKFGEEMAPYALGLCQNLAAAFWRCMNTEEADDEADDPGALAAVGCLRAISTILESVSRLPHLFVQIEPTLLPIMRRMLTTDGQEVFEEVLEIVSYMTFFSPTISLDMWSLWPLMIEALADWAIDFFPNILVPLDNYISRGTAHFLTCKEPDYQQSLWTMISSIMADKNLEDNDIEPAPKLIEVVFQNCRGQVDHWAEPYLRIVVDRLRRTEKSRLKCLLVQVIANAVYYNPTLTLSILNKLGVTTEVFNLWFQLLQQVRKSGVRANFKR